MMHRTYADVLISEVQLLSENLAVEDGDQQGLRTNSGLQLTVQTLLTKTPGYQIALISLRLTITFDGRRLRSSVT